jgi:murein DD-endopeptidase MepM/ murein hydrolase activator NlpD
MSDRAHVVLGSTLALLLAVPLGAATGGLTALVRRDGPSDRLSPLLEQRVRSAITVYEQKRKDLVQPRRVQPPEPFVYRFFPQAGVLGQDLFIVNFTDLNSSRRGILDWDCSGYTYEGHQGHDSVIRSFREQAIGVPVFAVRDGTVVDTHDGEPDMNTEQNDVPANFVVIDHGVWR